MLTITDKKQCCGCTACSTICPKQAITLKPDAEGFLYPSVDVERCINCELCIRVCAFNNHYDRTKSYEVPLVFGAFNKDKNQVAHSQSGGIFHTLAQYIISRGGVVYGASFQGVNKVCHKRASTIGELELLRGSKYVQSDLKDTYSNIVADLKEGKTVLFSGTGCQAAGLHSLILTKKLDGSKLYICDIVCHGVPSPLVWSENIKWIEKKNNNKVKKANFRDKNLFGWHSSTSSYLLENGKTVVSNKFNLAFGLGYINRHSCDVCYFANTKRPSDITVGDFWGLKMVNAKLDAEDKGVSLVIINTDKGKILFESVKEDLVFFESNLNEVRQPNLETPSVPSPNRDEFMHLFLTKGYKKALNSFPELRDRSVFYKVIAKVISILKNFH